MMSQLTSVHSSDVGTAGPRQNRELLRCLHVSTAAARCLLGYERRTRRMRTPTASTVLHHDFTLSSKRNPSSTSDDGLVGAMELICRCFGSSGKKSWLLQPTKSKTRLDFAQHGEGCHTAPHRPHQKRRKRTACIHTHPPTRTNAPIPTRCRRCCCSSSTPGCRSST